MPAFTGTNELDLGGAMEEFHELLRGPLERDEFYRAMLKAQEVQISLLTQQLGATPSIELVGGPGDGTTRNTTNITYERDSQPLGLGQFIVAESDELAEANADGSVTVTAGGGEQPLVRHRAETEGIALLAIGAADADNTEYAIKTDGQTIGGWTQSPLGTITAPFSLVDDLGAVVPADGTIEYVARRTDAATGPVDLAARAFVEDA